MDSQPTIRIVVKDSHKRRDPLDPEDTVVWHTLDRLEGYVIIQTSALLMFDKTDMRLEGHSRVWIKVMGEGSSISSVKASRNFLFQSQEVADIERVEHANPEFSGYIVPFCFVIPKWALFKSVVPHQCLSLPPSISMGQALPWYQEPEVYAQPNISYHLRSLVRYHTSEESKVQTLETWKEVKIVPITDILPPTDTQDFAAEFVESQTHTFRMSIFGGPAYSMTLSMNEPSAIVLRDMQTQVTASAEFAVDIKAAEGNMDEKNVDQLPHSLRKLKFNVEPIFRAKTFYSTSPFTKLPGQTMLTLNGDARLQDGVMKQDTLCARPDSWQYFSRDMTPSYAEALRRPSSQSGNSTRGGNGNASFSISPSSPRSWSARMRFPLLIPADLPPTFCSTLVARQYSLITRIKVSGVSVKPFVLEVPIQVVYSPAEAMKGSLVPESAPETALNAEDHILEELPGYS